MNNVCRIYDPPWTWEKGELIKVIEHYKLMGKDNHEIGAMFGVGAQAIKYHWDRYKLGKYKKYWFKAEDISDHINYKLACFNHIGKITGFPEDLYGVWIG